MVATVDEQLKQWLAAFNAAAATADVDALLALFKPDAFWRDLLAFTWNVQTADGLSHIRDMLEACLARTAPTAWRQAGPAALNDGVIEGVATFETKVGHCKAVIRLKDRKAWIVLTSMVALKGVDETPRPQHHDVQHRNTRAPLQQPYCVIVGAGHCGLGLAVQLKKLGVPTLVIDARERPSDTWRDRHDSLALHSPSYFDEMPGFAYPDNWPLHPSKDQFADWLDAYQSVNGLDVLTGTRCIKAEFNDASGKWKLQVRRGDGAAELNPEQLVFATGIFGAPNLPEIPGKQTFKGLQQHAGLYRNSRDYKGRRCIVVGAGTTAHDVAADLWSCGADVTMIQRSPTIVMRLEVLIEGFSQLYGPKARERGITTAVGDLLFAATPMRVLVGIHQKLVAHVKQQDAAFYRRLEDAGFLLTFGEDESGVFPQVLRNPGGYYIDVGASELVANGSIKLRSGVGLKELREDAVVLSDGSELAADMIFYATGYERKSFEPILGAETARKVGLLWGLGSGMRNDPGPWEGELRNMWKPTAQRGLWFHGGGIGLARSSSHTLALQIKARHAGLPTPVYTRPIEMPAPNEPVMA